MIERIVAPLGLRVDATSPWVDAGLPDGSRVQTRFLSARFRSMDAARSTGLLDHSVEVPAVRDPLELVLASVLEGETRAGHKILDRLGDENFGRTRE